MLNMKFTSMNKIASFFYLLLLTTTATFAQISGTVFRDFNGNGVKDANEPLVQGLTVNAYLANGVTTCGTTTTTGGAAPNYTLSGCGTAAVRVEFILPATGICVQSGIDFSSFSGTDNATSVQFVSGNSTDVNFSLHNPEDYNQGATDISVFIPCYISGDPLVAGDAANGDWLVGFPYNNGSTGAVPNENSTTVPSQKVNGAVIGATWGIAYSKQAKKVFTSAFLKRHVGLGKLGSGGIYMLEPTATSFNVTEFYDLDNNGHRTRAAVSAPVYGEGTSYSIAADNSTISYLGTNDPLTGKPVGLGVIGTNTQRGLTSNPLDPSYDPATFGQIAKVGLGDIDISDEGKFLFVMNLYSKKVFRLELNSANNPTSVVNVTSYDIPATTCVNGEYRPFGLKFFRDKLYIGVVCNGENDGTITDLNASVFEMTNPTTTATFNTSPLLNIPLNFTRDDYWEPWINDSNDPNPSPILSDIEFSDNGDMILGFMDRSGHQWGEQNRRFLKTETTSYSYSTEGDILIAGLNCNTATFVLENNGSIASGNGSNLSGNNNNINQGPGGKEFFNDDSPNGDPHKETVIGSLAVLKGQGAVFMAAFAIFSGGGNSGDAGTIKLSTINGGYIPNSGYKLYNRPVVGIFAKANGLGDVELSGIEAPIEIGNRIWKDTDSDGVQDANEAGIDGVEIELVEAGSVVATATSANGGQWYFNSSNVNGGLKANTNYVIRVRTTLNTGSLAGCIAYTVKDAPTGGMQDSGDSDVGTDGTISYRTGSFGENNHTLDIGLVSPPPCPTPNCLGVTVIKN
jgi:hypothetical protein